MPVRTPAPKRLRTRSTSAAAKPLANTKTAPVKAATKKPALAARTQLREVPEAVYSLLGRATAPLTAYDLIEGVQQHLHRRLHPPTIYRALSQLVEHGLVHRLESGSSYVACTSPGEPHHSILLLCNRCGSVEEADDARVHRLLREDAAQRDFAAESEVIEVRGTCAQCRTPA